MLALEMPMDQVLESIGYIRGVDGRMELLEHPYPFTVIVDYCQHAKSFEKVFQFADVYKRQSLYIRVCSSSVRKPLTRDI